MKRLSILNETEYPKDRDIVLFHIGQLMTYLHEPITEILPYLQEAKRCFQLCGNNVLAGNVDEFTSLLFLQK